jgi:hypothetical protein
MGEAARNRFQPTFNRTARVQASTTPLSEDAGAIALREVAEALRLPAALRELTDPRDARRVTHPLQELVLSRVLLLAQGWQDQDDADLLREDPALRIAVSSRAGDRPLRNAQKARQPAGLASQPTMSRLNHALASPQNLQVLSRALLETGRRRACPRRRRRAQIVIDVDSFPLRAHGRQDGARYNGHYRYICTHPLVAFTDTGEILGILLRPGNVHTAHDVRSFLEPILDALREDCDELVLRVDSGFADGKLFAWLAARGVRVITRLRSHGGLRATIQAWAAGVTADWAAVPAEDGKPRHALKEFEHRASTWAAPMRVIGVMIERNASKGELFHHQFFVAANLGDEVDAEALLACYRARGIAELHIGELKRVLAPRLSSASRRRAGRAYEGPTVGINDNAVVLLLSAIAYNLMHALRRGIEAETGQGLSLDRLREQVLKAACVAVRHGRRVCFRVCSSRTAWWRALSAAVHAMGLRPEVAA